MNHVWNISSKSLIHRKSVQENKNILHRSKAHGLSKIHIWKNWELHRRNSFNKGFELQKIRYHKKPSFYNTSPKIWQMKTTRYQKSITRLTDDECSWMKCDVTELNALFVNKDKAGLRYHLFPPLTAKSSCEPMLAWSRRSSDFRAHST